MKTCTKCGETKPVTEFGKETKARDGLRTHCKACINAYKIAWSAANRVEVNAYHAAYRAANRENLKAIKAKWSAENPEVLKASRAKWGANHPESFRVKQQNRRARERKNGGKLSKGIASKLIVLQKGRCACGCKQPLGDDYHLDHIMPVALGGANVDENIQLLRATCNHRKSAKHPIDFMQQRGFLL